MQTTILIVATMTTGFSTGVFLLYAHTVMPALAGLDDRTFVAAFGALDRAIVNPWFMTTAFLGALVSTATAVVVHRGLATLPWIVVALVLYAVCVAVTVAVHLPLNDALKAAGDPHRLADATAVRRAFHEGRWVMWNLVRVGAGTCAFGCLSWACVLYGRVSG